MLLLLVLLFCLKHTHVLRRTFIVHANRQRVLNTHTHTHTRSEHKRKKNQTQPFAYEYLPPHHRGCNRNAFEFSCGVEWVDGSYICMFSTNCRDCILEKINFPIANHRITSLPANKPVSETQTRAFEAKHWLGCFLSGCRRDFVTINGNRNHCSKHTYVKSKETRI